MLRKQSHGLKKKKNPQWKQLWAIISYRALIWDRRSLQKGPAIWQTPREQRVASLCLSSSRLLPVRPGLALHYLLLAPLVPSVPSPLEVSVPGEMLTVCTHLPAVEQKATESLLPEGSPAGQQRARPASQKHARVLLARANRASGLLPLGAPPLRSLLCPLLELVLCHLSDQRTDPSRARQTPGSIQVWKSCWSV